jgi:hypothetical protein
MSLQTTGTESEGETCTRSRLEFFAESSAKSILTIPFLLPLASISITSEALIFSLIGVIFLLLEAMTLTCYKKRKLIDMNNITKGDFDYLNKYIAEPNILLILN